MEEYGYVLLPKTEKLTTALGHEYYEWGPAEWMIAFEGTYASSEPTWRKATPPPKDMVEPITAKDVNKVLHFWAKSYMEYQDHKMVAVMELKGSKGYACVSTWSDSSGYGCQDSIEWHIGDKLDDIIRWGLTDEDRKHLGL